MTVGTYDATFGIPSIQDLTPLRQCRIRYQPIKRDTFALVEEEFLRATMLRIDVKHIDDEAERALAEDWAQYKRLGGFDWIGSIVPVIRKSHPRGLEMAIWCQGRLCGLAAIRLSNAKTWLSLTHLEGHPDRGHPLKNRVLPTVISAMDIYATLVQQADSVGRKPTLRIMRPLPGTLDRYRELGYSSIQSGKGDGRKFQYVVASEGEHHEQR